MSEAPVIVAVDGKVGRLTLNRPDALHALNTPMCRLMIDALLAWRSDPAVTVVQIDHAGPRGFCAGGDIRMLAESGAGDGRAARDFFHTEYRLNALLQAYRSGERSHPTMRAIASALTDQAMADLAAFYGQGGLRPAPAAGK